MRLSVLLAFLLTAASAQAQPTFSRSFAPNAIGPGSQTTLTYFLTNPEPVRIDGLAFTDSFAGQEGVGAGLMVASPAQATTTCPAEQGGAVVLTATEGSSVVSFSGASLPAGASCTVTVNATASTPAVYETSAVLSSSVGDSQPASATLTVDANRIGFTKSFAPASVPFGGRSRLTYVLDASASGNSFNSLAVTDMLPEGITVADPANASTTCETAQVAASPGSSQVVLSNPIGVVFLSAGATCTVSVDVIGSVIGQLGSVSGDLSARNQTFVILSNGLAGATLGVTGGGLQLTKTFVDDPAAPGGTVTARYRVTNLSRLDQATAIAFEDDLDAALLGLAATGTPTPACGGTVSGTSTLVLSDGVLAPEASCSFDVSLQIPAGASPGTYPAATSSITATVGGSVVTGAPASDDLFVAFVPTFAKSITPDPASGGELVTVAYTITNTDTGNGLTDLRMDDPLSGDIGGAVIESLPANGSCGPGSVFFVQSVGGISTFSFSGGAVDPGASCTFDVGVRLAAGTPTGEYVTTSGPLQGQLGGAAVTSPGATATFQVFSPPALSVSLPPEAVQPGGTVDLTIAINQSDEDTFGASELGFTLDLAALPGLSATGLPIMGCGGTLSGSAGDTFLTFSGGSLLPAEDCTFDVTLAVDVSAASGTTTLTTSPLSATVSGQAVTGVAASADLTVSSLTFSTTFVGDPVNPGTALDVTFDIANVSATANATAVTFTDNFSSVITGMTITSAGEADVCGPGSQSIVSGSSFFIVTGGALAPGESCQISATVLVPANAASGDYTNVTSALTFQEGGTSRAIPAATDVLTVTEDVPPLFTAAFGPTVIATNGTSTLTLTIDNAASLAEAAGLAVATALPTNVVVATPSSASTSCAGGTLTAADGGTSVSYTGGSVAGGASCTISLDITGTAPDLYTVTTGDLTSSLGNSGPASADLRVAEMMFAKTFAEDGVAAGGSTDLTFTLTNGSTADTYQRLAFSDDLDAFLTGAVASGTPQTDVCGTGSQLTGTSVLSLSDGTLAPGESCSFTVTVVLPGAASPGMYVNETSALTARVGVADVTLPAATDALQVFVPPTFAKAFAPDAVLFGEGSTLTFTIDNTAEVAAATDLAFADDFPAGLVIATPSNASTTCTGGTLTAADGASALTYTGGTVAAGTACEVTVDVISTTPGTFLNTSGDLTSSLGNSGPAAATLAVASPPPAFAKAFSPEEILAGGVSTLTLSIDNAVATEAASDLDVTDNLPAGMTVATPSNATTTCTGGTLTAADGASTLTYTGGTVAAGASCTVAVDVTSATPGDLVNTTGELTSSLGTSGTASATLTVSAAPPTFTKAFAPETVALGGRSTLTLVIDNAAAPVAATDLTFTDALPSGMVIATPGNAAATCTDGTLVAIDGASTLSYSGGTVAASASCTISVDVTGTEVGALVNTTSDLTSSLGNSGPASATLTVEQPALLATKAFALFDRDNPRTADEGETIRYTIEASVEDGRTLSGVVFDDVLSPYTALRVGSVSTNVGVVTSGNDPGDTSVSVNLGTLTPASGTVKITFNTAVVGGIPESVAVLCNQGTFTGDFPVVGTDDPSEPGISDPTCTPVTQPDVNIEVVSLTAERGGQVVMQGTLTNTTANPIRVQVSGRLLTPDGQTIPSEGRRVSVQPGATIGPAQLIRGINLSASAPDGLYRLTLDAVTVNTSRLVDTDVVEFTLTPAGMLADASDATTADADVPAAAVAAPAAASLSAEDLAAIEPGAGPNPFLGRTVIRYGLPEAAQVDLRVFDLQGRLVAVLQSGSRPAGLEEVVFDASARPVGVYIWRLSIDGEVTTGRVTLVR